MLVAKALTLKQSTSPAVTVVVHPVSVVSSPFWADDKAMGALADILSATNGGKFAKLSFQTSTLIVPETSAMM
jgi:hypothetical protein